MSLRIQRDYTNLTWTQGRRLSSITKGSQTYSYQYDMSGVRSVKIAEGLKHEYVTQNGRVVRDYVTNADTGAFVRCLDFFYDQSGRPFAMRSNYDSTLIGYDTFHYVLNAQGDVVQLNYQGKQDKVYAQYTYDAWGNTKSGSLADVNPLRYRGYYCDTETGFYYLQSRYYDPAVRRFLNADSYGSTGQGFLGYNMFAYCNNNPVMCIDDSGDDPIWFWLFLDHCFGFIHFAVQWHIVTNNPGIGMEKAVYNSSNKECGRADIFDLTTGEVWEIKTKKTGAGAAIDRINKYCEKNALGTMQIG